MINQTLGIIGFGSQAKAWALNLRDSKNSVIIYLRSGSKSAELCRELGFEVRELETSQFSDVNYLCLLTPDHTHTEILENLNLENKKILLAHGYSYSYEKLGEKFPQNDYILLAPKAIASEIRLSYETKQKVAALMSFEGVREEKKNEACEMTLCIAEDLGFTCGPFISSFENETKADLFSEQAILCSTLPYLPLFAYNKLREAGVEKEAAYLECFHEIKLIINALAEYGPAKFFDLISPNALIGSQKGLKYLFDENFQTKLSKLFEEIDNDQIKKEFDETDIKELKENVVKFWESQEFSQTHTKIQSMLKS